MVTEDWLKSEYTVLLSGYISWPDEAEKDTFHVGVLSSGGIYTQLSLKSQFQTLKNRPFRVSNYRKLKQLRSAPSLDILYVGEEKNRSLRRIYSLYEEKPVLLITDSAKNTQYTMLNLLGMNLAGDKPFWINKTLIDRAGLKVSPKILLIGGNEEDLRDIYRELEAEGDRMRSALDTLNLELARKQKKLAESQQRIESQSIEVQNLVQEIDRQTAQLTTLSDSVDLKQMDLVEKVRLLGAQEERIKLRESEIEGLNRQVTEKEQEIAERSKMIRKQLENIEKQSDMIEEQGKILDNQKIQIERQKMVLWFFLILSGLILGTGFFIFRAYRIKKRANRILKEKNQVIEEQNQNILNQKEEIETQRDRLQKVNVRIERQNENITASIYYALTIQQAMLPDTDEMNRLYESFIIYLPKDIVSGDFYWFARRGRNKSGERSCYYAVVDCTGHGVPGGFLSMIGARILDAIVNEQKITQTDEILELMDKRVRQALNQNKSDNEDGMDVCLCKFTSQDGEDKDQNVYLSFSGARRPLFLLRRGKEIEMVRGDRRTIGGKHFNPNPFTKYELSLKRGDRLYLTSDGLMDQHSPEREKFGRVRFMSLMNEHADLDLHSQQDKLEEEIFRFMRKEKQRDDITILGINL